MLWEAAKEWGGYTMSSFHREDAVTQGWVLGSYLVKKHREAYETERQQAEAKRKGKEKELREQASHPAYRHREAMLRDRLEQERKAKGG